MTTMSIFYCQEMLQLKNLGIREYIEDFYNWIDQILFYTFVIYFWQRIEFSHCLLPSYYYDKSLLTNPNDVDNDIKLPHGSSVH